MSNPESNPCNYHSANSAVWYCDECAVNYCADCVVVTIDNVTDVRCHLCEKHLEFLGTAGNAPRFWTVAQKFFRFPFGASGLILIGMVTFLAMFYQTGLVFGLFSLLLSLAIVVKYCFASLEQVAMGDMTTPSVGDAISGDEHNLFLQFVGLLVILGFLQLAADVLVGTAFGTFVSILFTLFTPAMAICLAIDKSALSALNLGKLLQLMAQIGLPYLLLVFLWNVISTGPYIVFSVFGQSLEGTVWAMPAFAAVSTYFAIVMFAMLGYVLYENQAKLGYVAGDPADVALTSTPQNKRKQIFGQVNVLLKEGRKDAALRTMERNRVEFSTDTAYCDRYLALALQSRNQQAIEDLANPYMEMLLGREAFEPALEVWRKVVQVQKSFKPKSPDVSHTLAETAYGRNLLKEALALLANLHKRSPTYTHLADAYRLAMKVMEERGDAKQARQLAEFIDKKLPS